jgi:hypothetical protein
MTTTPWKRLAWPTGSGTGRQSSSSVSGIRLPRRPGGRSASSPAVASRWVTPVTASMVTYFVGEWVGSATSGRATSGV